MISRPGTFMSGGAGNASYDPLPIPNSSLQLWLKADAGTFSDVAMTLPVTADASLVRGWQDQSGNGRHATYLQTGTNSVATLSTVGSYRIISCPSQTAFLFTNPLTSMATSDIFVVARDSATSFGAMLLQHSVAGVNNAYFYSTRRVDGGFAYHMQGSEAATSTTSADAICLFNGKHNSTTISAALNNGSFTNAAAANKLFTADTIGAAQYSAATITSYDPTGQLMEYIAYDRILSNAERATVNSYLNAKYTIY